MFPLHHSCQARCTRRRRSLPFRARPIKEDAPLPVSLPSDSGVVVKSRAYRHRQRLCSFPMPGSHPLRGAQSGCTPISFYRNQGVYCPPIRGAVEHWSLVQPARFRPPRPHLWPVSRLTMMARAASSSEWTFQGFLGLSRGVGYVAAETAKRNSSSIGSRNRSIEWILFPLPGVRSPEPVRECHPGR